MRKYGGAGLSRPEQIVEVAKATADLRKQGHSVVLVVSAMGKTTDQLVDLAHSVSSAPNRRELDMLLSTGERVSMALMSMALHELGCPAISFTGSQAGVFTNSSHSDAHIVDIRPVRVESALQEGKVVVIAGFQGVNPETKEITTLGRGGSDTTAVALAAHFQSPRCEIIKNVPGICSADPRYVVNPTTYLSLPAQVAAEMSFWGAKILHYRSVELAQALKVPLFVGNIHDENGGTHLTLNAAGDEDMYESGRILSVNSHSVVETFEIQSDSMNSALNEWSNFLNKHQLPHPQILASAAEPSKARVMVTAPPETLSSIRELVTGVKNISCINESLCSVTATCYGSTSSQLSDKIVQLLANHEIGVKKMTLSSMSISCFVPVEHQERAVQLIHKLIDNSENGN